MRSRTAVSLSRSAPARPSTPRRSRVEPFVRRPRTAAALALSLSLGVAAVCLSPGTAVACAVCQSGVPPAASVDSPSGKGFSFGLDARVGAASVGRYRVDERRLELLASYDFLTRYGVDVGIPGLSRTVSRADGPGTELASLGDVETRLRYLAWRRHEAALSLFAGVKWPTAPVTSGASGTPLPAALQPGCSSIAPFAGAYASFTDAGWTLTGIGQLLLPFAVRDAPHTGDSLRLAGSAERLLTSWFSTRGSLSLRLETGGSLSGDAPDPNSGGAVLYVTTEALFHPAGRLSGVLGASFPVVQGWFGRRHETPVLAASVLVRL